MADIVAKTVDPGGTGDYSSLDAWEDAFGGTAGGGTPGNLPAGDEIAVAECMSSNGAHDTTPFEIVGWTTDATRYILITGDSAIGDGDGDFPADGVYDGTKYVLHNNDSDLLFGGITEEYVRFRQIQLLATQSGTNQRIILYMGSVGTTDIRLDSCIFKCLNDAGGGGYAYAFNNGDSTCTANIFNCVFTGFKNDTKNTYRALNIRGINNIYNCTFYNNYAGIVQGNETTQTVINCVFADNTDDFVGTFDTIDYCATDEHAGGGDNGINISAVWDTTCFTDYSNGDFSVQDVDSPLYEAGDKTTPDGLFLVDIIDETRKATWDVGAYELVAAAPSGDPFMTTNTGFWGALP